MHCVLLVCLGFVVAEEAHQAHSQLTELRRAYEKKVMSEGKSLQEADEEHAKGIGVNSGVKSGEEKQNGLDNAPPSEAVEEEKSSSTKGKKKKKSSKQQQGSETARPTNTADGAEANRPFQVPVIHMVSTRYPCCICQ
jgi:hypothetical protein